MYMYMSMYMYMYIYIYDMLFFLKWTWHGHCWQVRGPGTVHFPGTDMTGGDDPCLPRCPRWFLHRKTPWVSQNLMVYSWWHHKSSWISIMIINGETIIKFNHNSIMMVSYDKQWCHFHQFNFWNRNLAYSNLWNYEGLHHHWIILV